MRNFVTIGLAGLIAGASSAPASAQDAAGQASADRPRIFAPLLADIERFEEVGSGEFGFGSNVSQTIEGWDAHDFDTIVMMATDNSAMCSGLNITYASGEEEAYSLRAPGLLTNQQIYEIVPRGNAADISAIDANCRALSGEGVTIAFYGTTGGLF